MLLDISEQVELTPLQHHLWEETLTAFSWAAPPYTSLLYDLLNPDRDRMIATFLGTSRVPPWFLAGTNSKRLFLCADRYFDLPLQQRIFLNAHEVSHPMLGHIISSAYYRKLGYIQVGFKKLPYNDKLANMAQDYVINDMLIQSRIGEFIKWGLHDPTIGTWMDSWIDVYEKLLTEGGGKGREDHRFDMHMDFGQEIEPDEIVVSPEMMEVELERARQAVAAAMEVGRQRGKLPLSLQKKFEKILEPVVDWTEHIRSLFYRKLGSGTYDFKRPDRRLMMRDIFVPGRSSFKAKTVIIGADSSGSIYGVPQLIERWMAECQGVLTDVKPEETHMVWCDAKVQRVDVLTDPNDIGTVIHKGAKGGGGTSFVPVFEYAEKLDRDIDCLVYLTDGYGTFPKKAPPYPVIWGNISPEVKYPFGDVVNIPVPNPRS